MRHILLLAMLHLLTVLCSNNYVFTEAEIASSLDEQLSNAKTRQELFTLWQIAKTNLVLSNKLPISVKLVENLSISDDETELWINTEEYSLEYIRRKIRTQILQHPDKLSILLGSHSKTRFSDDTSVKIQNKTQFITFCNDDTKNNNLEGAKVENKWFRYGMIEYMLLHNITCHKWKQNEEEEDDDIFLLFSLSKLSQDIFYEEKESENILEKVMEIAYRTNLPISHMILARYFGTRKITQKQYQRRDCHRSIGHIIQVIESTFHLVKNSFSGGLERFSRISSSSVSFIDSFDTTTIMTSTMHKTADEFDQEIDYLKQFGNEDPIVLQQLGDLLYFGAPHLNRIGNVDLARNIYERNMEIHQYGKSASNLATMLLNGEITIKNGDGEKEEVNKTVFNLYNKSAIWGDPMGYIGMGVFYLEGGISDMNINVSLALENFLLAGIAGLYEGDYRAARIYLYYSGFIDVKKGLYHMKIAADQGHVLACYEYGLYLFEWMVPTTKTGINDDNEMDSMCEEPLKYLLSAARSDWTDQIISFDSSKGIEAYEAGNYPLAIQIFLFARVGLWQKEAEMNAAFLLENFDRHALHLNVFQSIWNLLEERESQNTSVFVKNLYLSAAYNSQIGQAFRRLGDLYYEEFNEKDQGLWFYRLGADLNDAESSWKLGILRNNSTLAEFDFTKAIMNDPYAWFVVIASKIWLFFNNHANIH